MSSVVTVRLPDELGSQLAELAARTHRTKAFYIREAVEAQLQDLADAYLAAELSRKVATGELATGSWSRLREEFGATGETDSDLLDDVR